jgi:drug/metabolite transporter (DMT)-like permease
MLFADLLRLIEDMPEQHHVWRRFGLRLAAIAGAFSFAVAATVLDHPEQDLPLWPAWIFGALASGGLLIAFAAALRLPPFRGPRRPRAT